MKNILLYSLLVLGMACQKKEMGYPPVQTNKGIVEATANGEKWPDKGNIIQCCADNTGNYDPILFPCGKKATYITFFSFDSPYYYVRMSGGFYIEEKIGSFFVKQNDDNTIDCSNLPVASLSFYSDNDDAVYSSYNIDLTKANKITIAEIKEHSIVGSFELFYTKNSGFNNAEYPLDLHVVCTKFVAEK